MSSLLDTISTDKSALLAFSGIIDKIAVAQGIELRGSKKEITAAAGVNRTFYYQKEAEFTKILQNTSMTSKGRPEESGGGQVNDIEALQLENTVLKRQIRYPGSVVEHESRTTYSLPYKRFILDLYDRENFPLNVFSEIVAISLKTLEKWRQQDKKEPIRPEPKVPEQPNYQGYCPSECVQTLACDFEAWEGNTKDFLIRSAQRTGLPIHQIKNLLITIGMIKPKIGVKKNRNRGSRATPSPGAILETDGKEVKVHLSASNETKTYNWQGIVDQGSMAHTAVTVTDTECAEGVKKAFDETCAQLGKAPEALVHDGLPIYQDEDLRKHIDSKGTVMIQAQKARPENKASIEGEFGKFEQQVGPIKLDDSSKETLIKSCLENIVKAYTAGINHAARFEHNGKSRLEILKSGKKDPERDRKLIEQLAARHQGSFPSIPHRDFEVSLPILNEYWQSSGLIDQDPKTKKLKWLASSFSYHAIVRGLEIFNRKLESGTFSPNGDRISYLIKVIRASEETLLIEKADTDFTKYAMETHQDLLSQYQKDLDLVQSESGSTTELAFTMADNALMGSIVLERAFWQEQLIKKLKKLPEAVRSVKDHVKRVYEADYHDRKNLIQQLTDIEFGLVS